jgi:hypothetical protein
MATLVELARHASRKYLVEIEETAPILLRQSSRQQLTTW